MQQIMYDQAALSLTQTELNMFDPIPENISTTTDSGIRDSEPPIVANPTQENYVEVSASNDLPPEYGFDNEGGRKQRGGAPTAEELAAAAAVRSKENSERKEQLGEATKQINEKMKKARERHREIQLVMQTRLADGLISVTGILNLVGSEILGRINPFGGLLPMNTTMQSLKKRRTQAEDAELARKKLTNISRQFNDISTALEQVINASEKVEGIIAEKSKLFSGEERIDVAETKRVKAIEEARTLEQARETQEINLKEKELQIEQAKRDKEKEKTKQKEEETKTAKAEALAIAAAAKSGGKKTKHHFPKISKKHTRRTGTGMGYKGMGTGHKGMGHMQRGGVDNSVVESEAAAGNTAAASNTAADAKAAEERLAKITEDLKKAAEQLQKATSDANAPPGADANAPTTTSAKGGSKSKKNKKSKRNNKSKKHNKKSKKRLHK
jgi:hypothetical protein